MAALPFQKSSGSDSKLSVCVHLPKCLSWKLGS